MRVVKFCFIALLVPMLAQAGRVRNLATSSKEIPVINLMTGRSTVLRFQAPPKKVVLGNQNYFSVEFIDSDITIQPQGVATSNLFVYGDGFTYGFILKVNAATDYDDLVFIRSKIPSLPNDKRESKSPVQKVAKPSLSYTLTGSKSSPVSIEGVTFKWSEQVEAYYGDIFISSKLNATTSIQSLNLTLTRNQVDVSSIAPVSEHDEIQPKSKVRVRLFTKLENRDALKLKLTLQNKEFVYDLKWKK